nr:HesA/MoeB/ThiF family protein [Candidatus Sigynarchaeota archaeon]
CPAVQLLVATGIGKIKIADGDIVELSNLPRQFLHYTADVGKQKVVSVVEKARQMNPDVQVELFEHYLDKSSIEHFLQGVDFVIEASDNFATKFLINDACMHFNIPLVIAGVVQFYGQILSIVPGKTACYRCVFQDAQEDNPAQSCSGVGVLGTAPALAGTIQANEAIKSLLGIGSNFPGKLFLFDLLDDDFRFIEVRRNEQCPACSGKNNRYYTSQNYERYIPKCD